MDNVQTIHKQCVCPLCKGQLELFSNHQHTWYTKIAKSGRVTQQRRKSDDGPIGVTGLNCMNPKCSFHMTVDEIQQKSSQYQYLLDMLV